MNTLSVLFQGSLFVAFVSFASTCKSAQLHADGEPVPLAAAVPNMELQTYYQSNKTQLEELASVAIDGSKPDVERTKALQDLWDTFPDAAEDVARSLFNDPSEKSAALSVEILSAATVMMDHRMSDSHSLSPLASYKMRRFEASRDCLRDALADKREGVRHPAAVVLASQSDKPALQKILELSGDSGVYKTSDAVRIVALAKSEFSGQLLAPYLDSQDVTAKTIAASCLASNLTYRAIVEAKILFNAESPLDSRLAVAEQLAGDERVANTLLRDPLTPPKLYMIAMSVYVSKQAVNFSGPELDSIMRSLDAYPQKSDLDPTHLKGLAEQLQFLKAERSE